MSEKTASVTIVIPTNDRDWLVRLAEVKGHKRTHPVTGEVGGNLSWSVKEAVSFLRSHFDQYQQEEAKRLAREMEG